MKVNLRKATWAFAISAALLATPGFANGYAAQDNRGGQDRGQDDRRGDQQQGDRRDNAQGDRQGYQQGDRRDDGHFRDGAPEGGYRQTCRDILVAGNTLQASCEKRNGKWKQTSLRNFDRCTDQIENNNGRLVCSR